MSSPEEGRSIGRNGYARGNDLSMNTTFNGTASSGGSPENTSPNANASKKRKLEPSCQACYLRKIKCDKRRPVCSSCIKRDIQLCEYIDRRELEPSELPPARKPSSHGLPHSRSHTPLPTSGSTGSVYSVSNGAHPSRYYAQPPPPPPPPPPAPVPSLDLANMPEEQLESLLDRVATILSKKLQINGGTGSSNKGAAPAVVNRAYGASKRPANSSPLVTLLAAESGSPEMEAWAWNALMSLPPDETIDFAVTFYCNELEPLVNCLNARIFQEQIAALKARRRVPGCAKTSSSSTAVGTTSSRADCTFTDDRTRHGSLSSSNTAAGTPAGCSLPTNAHPSAWASIQGSVAAAIVNTPSSAPGSAPSFAQIEGRPPSRSGQPLGQFKSQPETSVDLTVLSLLFAVLAAVNIFLEPEEAAEHGLAASPEDAKEAAVHFRKMSEQALTLSRWSDSPNITALQSIVCQRLLLLLGYRVTAIQCLNSAAIRAAASLGLHRLGSAVEDAIEWRKPAHGQDARKTELRLAEEAEQTGALPAWAKPDWHARAVADFEPGNHAMRELGRKVWFALVIMEWRVAPKFDQFYSGSPHLFSTKLPANLRDEELCDLPLYSPLPHIDPNRPTDRAYIEIALLLADASRRIVDDMVDGRVANYETVMQADGEIRAILGMFPAYYSFDLTGDQGSYLRTVMQQRPITSVQRVMAHEAVWHTLLRLHRQYMARGYTDPAYAHSTDTCIEASLFIVAVMEELERAKSRARKVWHNDIHLFHACIVLQIDLNRLAAGPITASIATKQRAVKNAVEILGKTRMAKPKPGLPVAPLAHFLEFQSREAERRREWEEEQLRQRAQDASPESRASRAASMPNANITAPLHPWVKEGPKAAQQSDAPLPTLAGDDFDEILRTFLSMPTTAPDDQQQAEHYAQTPGTPSNDTQYFLRELFMAQPSGVPQL